MACPWHESTPSTSCRERIISHITSNRLTATMSRNVNLLRVTRTSSSRVVVSSSFHDLQAKPSGLLTSAVGSAGPQAKGGEKPRKQNEMPSPSRRLIDCANTAVLTGGLVGHEDTDVASGPGILSRCLAINAETRPRHWTAQLGLLPQALARHACREALICACEVPAERDE